MKYYDYVVSLGGSCYTAVLLRNLNLQGATNVFDWSVGEIGVGGFSGKIDLICNHFANAFVLDDLEKFFYPDTRIPTWPIRNKKTGLHYIHDFPKSMSIEEYFPTYKQKYLKRVQRLYDSIEKSNNVLFLSIISGEILPIEDIKKAEKIINEIFNNKIDFLIIQNIDDGELQEKLVSNHVQLVLFPTVFVNGRGKFNPELEKYLNNSIITKYKLKYMQSEIDKLMVYTEKLSNFVSDKELIQVSEYFDIDWYVKTYSLTVENPAEHYLKVGYKQNMNPSLKFDGNKYLENNSDVKDAGQNPLVHYLRYGKIEGRKVWQVE